jgi:hypothetical protein
MRIRPLLKLKCMVVGMFTLFEIKLQPSCNQTMFRMELKCNYNFYPILFVIASNL